MHIYANHVYLEMFGYDDLDEIEGMPEAIYLFLNQTDISLTYETPSEYSLFDRVAAHGRALDAVVRFVSS